MVRFHGFGDLTTTRDEYVKSPIFSCFGHQWRLYIYPGGKNDSREGYVAVKLVNRSTSIIKIQYGYSIKDADGKEVVHHKSRTNEFGARARGSNNAWCTDDFAKRSKLILVDGSLVIEVRMKTTSTDKSFTQFVPTNPINKNVLELFMNEESADVVFEVGGEQQTKGSKHKRAKTSTTNFHAHRPILQKCAPTLYEMCGRSGEGGTTAVSITDVKPEIFKHMIYYAYGGKLQMMNLRTMQKTSLTHVTSMG